MSTDFRALCAELLKAVDDCDDYTLTEGATVARARAALAEPVGEPAPPDAGEAGELVALIRQISLAWEPDACLLGNMTAGQLTRAADLLEQRHPAPVPVAERLQQLEDLAADAVSGLRYIEQTHGRLYGVGWDRVYEKADRLQPGHALPLPSGEVQP